MMKIMQNMSCKIVHQKKYRVILKGKLFLIIMMLKKIHQTGLMSQNLQKLIKQSYPDISKKIWINIKNG